MTRDQMLKYKFQAYQRIIFTNPRNKQETEMVLLAVDFDCESLKMIPLDIDYYEAQEYWYSIENCMPSKWLQFKTKKDDTEPHL